VAEILQLTDYLDRRPAALSGGQRQRVAIGRAIIKKPSLILFDEPLSNLDSALRVQMRAELQRLHRELKATVVYVTHDQVEAMTMADRIVVLNKGLVAQAGCADGPLPQPDNEFVATFIGSPKMNTIPVQSPGLAGERARAKPDRPRRSIFTDANGTVPQGPLPRSAFARSTSSSPPTAKEISAPRSSSSSASASRPIMTVGSARTSRSMVRAEGDVADASARRPRLAQRRSAACHLFDSAGRVIRQAQAS
jgi:multiple sugar transport system ATP-binding protein